MEAKRKTLHSYSTFFVKDDLETIQSTQNCTACNHKLGFGHKNERSGFL